MKLASASSSFHFVLKTTWRREKCRAINLEGISLDDALREAIGKHLSLRSDQENILLRLLGWDFENNELHKQIFPTDFN